MSASPETDPAGGIGLPADLPAMFSDESGRHNPNIERRQRRLAGKVGFLGRFLEEGERVGWIASGSSPFGWLDQLTSGVANRCLLVFTDRRILHLPTKFDFTSRDSIAEIRFRDCRSIRAHPQGLTVEYRNGQRETFHDLNRGDRKKLGRWLEDARFGDAPETGHARVHLCPRCTEPLRPGQDACAGCALEFKNLATGRRNAVLYPGGGYFYTRHPFLGVAYGVFETLLIALFLFAVAETLDAIAAAVPILFGAGFLLAFEKALSVFHTDQFLSECIPTSRTIQENRGPLPRTGGRVRSALWIGAGLVGCLAGWVTWGFLANADGRLIEAARAGDVVQLERAIDSGADIEARDQEQQATALMLAAGAGESEAVRTLLARGADVHARDREQGTALIWSARFDSPETVEALLDAGSAVDAATRNGVTALLVAAENGYSDLVAHLVEAGADPDRANQQGMTPLMAAAIQRHLEIFRQLADAGADIEASGGDRVTFLMEAASAGRIDIVQALLEMGADSDARDVDGWTPLMWAAVGGHSAVVEELLRAGANPAARNNESATALDVAERAGQVSVIGILEGAESGIRDP